MNKARCDLRDLRAVLTRLVAARNKLLAEEMQRRDELLHERAHRQQLIEQLLTQVDRSRRLKERKQKGQART